MCNKIKFLIYVFFAHIYVNCYQNVEIATAILLFKCIKFVDICIQRNLIFPSKE